VLVFDLPLVVQAAFFTTLALYLLGMLLPQLVRRKPRLQNYLAHGAAASASVSGVVLGLAALVSQSPPFFSLPSTLPLLAIRLRLDPLSAFFVLLISLTGVAVSIYAVGYVRKFESHRPIGLLGGLYNAFLLSMTLVVMADDGFLFLLLWEIMSIVSYLLVVTEHEKADVRYAGFFYLVMTHVGTAFILATYLVFFQQTGDFSFEGFRQSVASLPEGFRTIVFLTALIGFGTKAGIIPLHVWLPYAHPAAPSHISALMSGVMIKTAIYGLIRVYFDFLGGDFPWWWGFTVLSVGAVSALLGVMYALMQHDLKSLLAYHSVENIGIILLGVGAGMIFETYGMSHLASLGLLAGLYHTLNHAMFKSLLFMGAGAVLSTTHTRNMEEYGGLIKTMPWTALFFLIGAVSISGLPPTNGFVSEWLTFQSLFLSFQLPDLLMKIMVPIGAAMLALTGALAVACFAKAFGISFLAMPRSPHAREAKEVAWSMRAGMGLLAAACLALGLAPMVVVPLLDRVTSEFTEATIAGRLVTEGGFALGPGLGIGFSSMSTPVLAILMIVTVPLTLLGVVLVGGRLRKRLSHTWGCGINLKPRMEYTATGFAQPIRQVFSMIYRPTVKVETEMLQESRYFAKRTTFELHLEPTFQKHLYDPVVGLFNRAAERLRVVQAGSLHLYLAYIFVTLLVLLLWIS
jgi:hydrogenase-4 component B